MSDRKFGWKASLPHRTDAKYAMHPEMAKTVHLPPLMDLEPLCSPIEDQGRHGSCVAHGTCAVLEFLELAELGAKLPAGDKAPEIFDANFNPISRWFVYWNARVAIDKTMPYVDEGTTVHSAIQVIKTMGMCRENLWPYVDELLTIKPSTRAYSEATQHKAIWNYKMDNTNLHQLKQCLAWGYPIIFGMSCYDSMMTEAVQKTGYIPYPKDGDQFQGGHCMAIVGYDDATHRFKIRNSWGTSWGLRGYGSIDYKYLTSADLAADFWTLRKNSPVT